MSSPNIVHLEADLLRQRSLHFLELKEQKEENKRLEEIQKLCQKIFKNSDKNNNKFDCEESGDEWSDLSTIGSSGLESTSRDCSLLANESSETLNDLNLEKSLLKAEINHLERQSDDDTDDDIDDSDDEDLKEFKRIEKEIKIQELNKCLNSIETQIQSKQTPLINVRPSAPLAESESLKEESPQRTTDDDMRDDAMTTETTEEDDTRRRQRRPLTLYIPAPEDEEMDLEQHIRELGHELSARPEVHVSRSTCCGYLYKLCQKSENNWRKRFFVFDRKLKAFYYFRKQSQKTRERKPNGGVPFEHIHDVYVDHTRASDTRHVFVVSTLARQYVLMSYKPEVMRIWVDIIVTGCQEQTFNDT